MRNRVAEVKRPLPRQALILIISQGISSVGASLTTFGLDVWVFKQTGSYSIFAFLAVLAALPGLVFAPFAGVLTDRFNKRRLLIICDLVSVLAVGLPLFMYSVEMLTVPLVGASIIMLALAQTLRWPSLSASVTILVKKEQLGRVNGLLQSFEGTSVIAGPLFGVLLLELLGLPGLLSLDGLTYLFSLVALTMITISMSKGGGEVSHSFERLSEELTFGFRWIIAHRGLRRLLLFFTFYNIAAAVFVVGFTPYILSFSSSRELGLGLSSVGLGMMLGGILFSRWGGPKDKEWGVIGGAASAAFCMVIWGMARDFPFMYVLAFIYGLMVPIINASSQTIWQAKVPIEIQGKVFAVRKMIAWGLNPIAILLSIPFATSVFGPLLDTISWLPVLWGEGQAGTIGLMISVFGLTIFVGTVVVIVNGGLRIEKYSLAGSRHLQMDGSLLQNALQKNIVGVNKAPELEMLDKTNSPVGVSNQIGKEYEL